MGSGEWRDATGEGASHSSSLIPHPHPSPSRPLPCRHGAFLYDSNDTIGKSLELYGEWSEGEVALFRSLLKAGDTVIEVGANVGAHTVFFARAVEPSGRVIAIEPEHLQFQMLCANLALNGFTNTHCYPVQLEDTTFDKRSFRIATLDSFELPHCRLVKVDDPERSLQVLKSGIRTIRRCQPVLYIRNSYQDSDTLVAFLGMLGYELYWHYPSLYHPGNFFQNPENIFGDRTVFNLLGFHRDHGIQVQGMERVNDSGAQFCP